MTSNGQAHAPVLDPRSDGAFWASSTLGGRIRRQRSALGLSQEQLAACLGVSRSIISYWEADKRSPDEEHFIQLIDALQTSRETLTSGLLVQSLLLNNQPGPLKHVRRLLIPSGAPPVGETIRQVRVLRGLRLDELARASGVDRDTISDVETGQVCPFY